MTMPANYAGKILFADLTRGTFSEERLPDKICSKFIGGNGFCIRILYEKLKAGIDPLGPENILCFAVGGLRGTSAPDSGRHVVVIRSPITGAWAESNSGGAFGPELKTAGYDAVLRIRKISCIFLFGFRYFCFR